MPKPKICPLHKGEKPSDSYCVESACAWYLEWAKSCSVPVAVGIMAEIDVNRFYATTMEEKDNA